jgi:hypothetical protein
MKAMKHSALLSTAAAAALIAASLPAGVALADENEFHEGSHTNDRAGNLVGPNGGATGGAAGNIGMGAVVDGPFPNGVVQTTITNPALGNGAPTTGQVGIATGWNFKLGTSFIGGSRIGPGGIGPAWAGAVSQSSSNSDAGANLDSGMATGPGNDVAADMSVEGMN